eukprot:snap_masked-scaffold_21-processed-gene-4.28-mRNA-1 protein AED:1.00 eAED:1.00 QI:0/-1/0/0/-1/1/1/0/316
MKAVITYFFGVNLILAQSNLRQEAKLTDLIPTGSIPNQYSNQATERALLKNELMFSEIKSLDDLTCLTPQPEGTDYAVSVVCTGEDDQQWAFEKTTRRIINKADQTKCLVYYAASVWVDNCDNETLTNQFEITTSTDGFIRAAEKVQSAVLAKIYGTPNDRVFLASEFDLFNPKQWTFPAAEMVLDANLIVSDYDGRCLTARYPGQNRVYAFECDHQPSQQWVFNAKTGQLRNVLDPNSCFALEHLNQNTWVRMEDCELGSDYQTFEVTAFSQGEIKSVANGMTLHSWPSSWESYVYVGTNSGSNDIYWSFIDIEN